MCHHAGSRAWVRIRSLAVAVAMLAATVALPGSPAAAATSHRVDLQVLVLTDGGPWTEAIRTQLAREGVPATTVDLSSGTRPAITAAFLADAAARRAKFQAIVSPNASGAATHGLSAAELTTLATYERTYGVRQVDAFVSPGGGVGLQAPTFAGTLDGTILTPTADARGDAFGYLGASLSVDDNDPAVSEVYGYLSPGTALGTGETFTPLLNATAGGVTGPVVGVYGHDYREELVITAAFNAGQAVFAELGHGLVTWMTRGLHLGYHRSYLTVHVDDVFLADSRWSTAGHCTPGDDCTDPSITTTDIRMTPSDVSKLVAWQNANGYALTMVYNAAGSDEAAAQSSGSDPLTAALTAPATENDFSWVNHTYSHTFLGCIQVVPTGQTWRCAVPGDTGPYVDASLVPGSEMLVNGIEWASQAKIDDEIQRNLDWEQSHPLTHFDPAALVTGEHSGLATMPQQLVDNPLLAPALAQTGVKYVASDASREMTSRAIGSAVTVPRHPMNIYYNAATYTDEVSEYNWIYTSAADGGSGLCQINPESSCITPLALGTPAAAQASFTDFILPGEVRTGYGFVISGDPRPFFAHQSNLSEDAILLPVVQGILDRYKAHIDVTKSPLVNADMKTAAQALSRMSGWASNQSSAAAFVDASGVHVSGAAGTEVPLTVPAGTTLNGISLDAYDGELSGWIAAPTTDAVVAVPAIPFGGYLGVTVPAAPAVTAIPGDVSLTVSWTSPDNGNLPLTGYTVRVFDATGTTLLQTLAAAADATSLVSTGLTNGTAYTVDVAATNALGTGAASDKTAAVTPRTVPGAPTSVSATPGNQLVHVGWAVPASDGGTAVTGYVVRVFAGDPTPVKTLTADATATSLDITQLTNGTAYTVDVAATNAAGTGAASDTTAAAIPVAVPGAPTIGTATPGNRSVTVTWTAPSDTGGSPITGYVVTVYQGALTTPVTTVTTDATARSATVTGLANGTAYAATVATVNAVGASPESAQSPAVVPATVPSAPGMVAPVRGNAQATVRWTAPAPNGSPITTYTVRVYAGTTITVVGTLAAPATARSLTVTKLTNGKPYTFTVTATNAAGTSAPSARSAAVIPMTVPGKPTIGRAASGTSGGTITAKATWKAPASNGGGTIAAYQVIALRLDSRGRVVQTIYSGKVSAKASSLTMRLPRVANYRFQVRALNAVGWGTASSASNLVRGR